MCRNWPCRVEVDGWCLQTQKNNLYHVDNFGSSRLQASQKFGVVGGRQEDESQVCVRSSEHPPSSCPSPVQPEKCGESFSRNQIRHLGALGGMRCRVKTERLSESLLGLQPSYPAWFPGWWHLRFCLPGQRFKKRKEKKSSFENWLCQEKKKTRETDILGVPKQNSRCP